MISRRLAMPRASGKAKKLIRSGLARTPRLYDLVTNQRRYRLYYRLGLVHDRDLRVLQQLVTKQQPVILDIGANIGQSILSIKRILPRAQIVSFEPNPTLYPDLARLEKRFDGVVVRQFGLGDRSGLFDLYWPVYRGRPMLALASITREGATIWWGPRAIYGFNANDLTIDHAVCTVCRMDDLDLCPDVIKIDTEGNDDAVLAGGLETIRAHRPIILVEGISPDLERRLDELRYRSVSVHRGRLVDHMPQKAERVLLPLQ